MVTHSGNRMAGSTTAARQIQVNSLGITSIAGAVVALVMVFVGDTRTVAWVPAMLAVAVAVVALSFGAGRKRYATAGLLLGWFGFSFSFALMLWG